MAITDTLMIDADHHLRDEEDHHPKGNIAEGPLLMTAAEAQMTAEGRMTAEVPHRREGGAHHEMVTVVTIDEDLHLKGGDLVLMTDEVHHLMTGEDPLLTDVDPLLTDADPHLMTDEDHLGGCRTSRKDHQMRSKFMGLGLENHCGDGLMFGRSMIFVSELITRILYF